MPVRPTAQSYIKSKRTIVLVVITILIFLILLAMTIIAFTSPSTLSLSVEVSQDPVINTVKAFLTPEECKYLITMCESNQRFQPSKVSGYEENATRTSTSAQILRGENDKIKAIESKAAQLLNVSVDYLESLQVVRYLPGEKFDAHHDYFHVGSINYDSEMANGQRQYTILIYLNDVIDGSGSTFFPEANLQIQPKMGLAVWWNNLQANGEENPRTLHSGEVVTQGVKYAVNVWSRTKRQV